MGRVKWDPAKFIAETEKNGLDGLEEFAKVVWHPQAFRDAPKRTTAMAESLRHDRDDKNKCVYVGGGGQAKDYILKQELDRSLHHEVGKAGFIGDSLQMHASEIGSYVKKHIEK